MAWNSVRHWYHHINTALLNLTTISTHTTVHLHPLVLTRACDSNLLLPTNPEHLHAVTSNFLHTLCGLPLNTIDTFTNLPTAELRRPWPYASDIPDTACTVVTAANKT